jgi:uncharacterized protein (TIGR02757 family)
MGETFTREGLEEAYERYNRRSFVHPDPLEFLFRYESGPDRELAGLIAACLAYGRVAQILKSIASILDATGPLSSYLATASRRELAGRFRHFKHRFTTGTEVAALLVGARAALEEHGSIEACFGSGLRPEDPDLVPAIGRFVAKLEAPSGGGCGSLLPTPGKGSACKRLNLYLRWMVRKDRVDPGGWDRALLPRLIVPLDVHMHRVATQHGLTKRRNADMRAALEITAGFAAFCPEDPVKYDFALTRPGIRGTA